MEMPSQRVLITVHGIRTFGQWQHRLATLVRSKIPSIQVESYGYGYFSLVAFLIPPLRWLATIRFRRELTRICAKYPHAQVTVVAHSFGTHLVAWGIRGIPEARRPQIHTIILAGSVLRSDFPWAELLDSGHVQQVVNDCGIDDAVLILSQFCVLLTGMAGRVGFLGASNNRFKNRFFKGGHSHYFEGDYFMSTHWVPWLVADEPDAPDVDQRVTAGPLQGFVLAAMQLAEPVKLAFYVGVPLVLIFLFHVQPLNEARSQRELASLLARSEQQKRTALELVHRSDVARLAAEEAARKAEAEKAAALAGQARAEADRANAESESYVWMTALSQQQQLLMREAFARQARLINMLPHDQRKAAYNESLVLLDNALRFDFDRATLEASTTAVLDQLVDGLSNSNVRGDIVITGHVGRFCLRRELDEPVLADDTAPASSCVHGMSVQYAQKLSERLARSVAEYLIKKGVSGGRVITRGKGVLEAGFPYPNRGYAKSWNLVARQNNQVRIRLE